MLCMWDMTFSRLCSLKRILVTILYRSRGMGMHTHTWTQMYLGSRWINLSGLPSSLWLTQKVMQSARKHFRHLLFPSLLTSCYNLCSQMSSTYQSQAVLRLYCTSSGPSFPCCNCSSSSAILPCKPHKRDQHAELLAENSLGNWPQVVLKAIVDLESKWVTHIPAQWISPAFRRGKA